MMQCNVCHEVIHAARYMNGLWYCNMHFPFTRRERPAYLHEKAGNKYAPSMTKAKEKVFERSVIRGGQPIDTVTGKEPAY